MALALAWAIGLRCLEELEGSIDTLKDTLWADAEGVGGRVVGVLEAVVEAIDLLDEPLVGGVEHGQTLFAFLTCLTALIAIVGLVDGVCLYVGPTVLDNLVVLDLLVVVVELIHTLQFVLERMPDGIEDSLVDIGGERCSLGRVVVGPGFTDDLPCFLHKVVTEEVIHGDAEFGFNGMYVAVNERGTLTDHLVVADSERRGDYLGAHAR